jgi:U3 small nucleolar RNA-associated protein 10
MFHEIVFPFLLFSRPRRKSAEVVWESIADGEGYKHVWLTGCADVWRSEMGGKEKVKKRKRGKGKDEEEIDKGEEAENDIADSMARVNAALADRIAGKT